MILLLHVESLLCTGPSAWCCGHAHADNQQKCLPCGGELKVDGVKQGGAHRTTALDWASAKPRHHMGYTSLDLVVLLARGDPLFLASGTESKFPFLGAWLASITWGPAQCERHGLVDVLRLVKLQPTCPSLLACSWKVQK